jgi:CubicO group peptidase (beta-lactamase class C family)
MSTTEIHGTCDSGFEQVRQAFAENFAERGEVGAAVCVVHEGRMVVDLWGGYADAARSRAWQQDTLVNVFSTTKGITALCAHILVDRGQLDLDAPVASYWPEFAQAGKDKIPVRYLLSHQAGLAGARQKLTAQDKA